MRTALIVGAGIGGLAAGIALRQAGWHVRIFERASSPRELGFGLALAPNAIAALRELGVVPTANFCESPDNFHTGRGLTATSATIPVSLFPASLLHRVEPS